MVGAVDFPKRPSVCLGVIACLSSADAFDVGLPNKDPIMVEV